MRRRRVWLLALFGAMEKPRGCQLLCGFCVEKDGEWGLLAFEDTKFILLLILIGNVIIMITQPKMISSF